MEQAEALVEKAAAIEDAGTAWFWLIWSSTVGQGFPLARPVPAHISNPPKRPWETNLAVPRMILGVGCNSNEQAFRARRNFRRFNFAQFSRGRAFPDFAEGEIAHRRHVKDRADGGRGQRGQAAAQIRRGGEGLPALRPGRPGWQVE